MDEMNIFYFILGFIIVGIPTVVYFFIINFVFNMIWEHPSGRGVVCWLVAHASVVAGLYWCYFHQFIPEAVSDTYDICFIITLSLCVIFFFYIFRQCAIVCPNCHTWNRFTTINVDREHYVSRETVRRDVYNNRGQVIGGFDDVVDVNRVRRHGKYKCDHCGTVFNQTSE